MPPKTAAKTTRRRRSKKPGVTISDAIRLLTEQYGPFENEPRLDPAHELVFTILSQHTSDRNSERAFRNLMHTFGTLEAVAEAEVADIEEAISGGGLARVKAPRIKDVLGMILDLNDGSLDLHFLAEMPMDEARAWLRQLPGIGPKSAGIILSFSLGMPAMAVDTHIFRVSQRLGIIGPKVNADKAHEVLEAAMPPEDVYPFHVAFITHGRQVCKAQRPRCGACVVNYGCPSRDEEAIRLAAANSEPAETEPVSRETADNDRPDGQAPGRRRRRKEAPTPVPHTQVVKELQP
ncbi:MAG: endonuclease III [Chloroflexota bacterium]|nr:endonuclease III [Chloroflexota bacterium]MDE2961749.1 endonuclease III [Chloroflexota bacterium]